MRLNFLILFFTMFAISNSFAEETSLFLDRNNDVQTKIKKGELAVGLEVAQIQPAVGAALVGIGPRFGVDYDIGYGFSLNPCVSLVSSGSTFIYSGVGGNFRYTVLGNLATRERVLTSNGVPIVTQLIPTSNRLSVGFGLEQLFLNGSQSIYPAVGLSASLAYSVTLFQKRFEIVGRYSQLTANQRSLPSLFIDFSFLLGI